MSLKQKEKKKKKKKKKKKLYHSIFKTLLSEI